MDAQYCPIRGALPCVLPGNPQKARFRIPPGSDIDQVDKIGGVNERNAREFLAHKPDSEQSRQMFEVPASYQGNRYTLRKGAALAGLSATALPVCTVVPALAPGVWPAAGFVALSAAGLVFAAVETRIRTIARGRPLGGWNIGYPSKPVSYNAGRTFLPEYAEYQEQLDRLWIKKQGRRPRWLRSRTDKTQGRVPNWKQAISSSRKSRPL